MPKTLWKILFSKRENWTNQTVLRFYNKSRNMPHVVFNEEFKTGIGFEIKHDSKMLTYAQCLSDGQSSFSLKYHSLRNLNTFFKNIKIKLVKCASIGWKHYMSLSQSCICIHVYDNIKLCNMVQTLQRHGFHDYLCKWLYLTSKCYDTESTFQNCDVNSQQSCQKCNNISGTW